MEIDFSKIVGTMLKVVFRLILPALPSDLTQHITVNVFDTGLVARSFS